MFGSFIIALFLVSFVLVSSVHLGGAQTSGTPVGGIINGFVPWIAANSPYNLIGDVYINNGSTLTIGAGVTVNLNGYFIEVNGTLSATGTSTDQIFFNDGYQPGEGIMFYSTSTEWNPSNGTGCIIANAVFDSVGLDISGAEPRIIWDLFYNSGNYTSASYAIDVSGPLPSSTEMTIFNNTFASTYENAIEINSIYSSAQAPAIEGNNFYCVNSCDLKVFDSTVNIDAIYNWWGTNDSQTISQTISGNVTFEPCLSLPNPGAPTYNVQTPADIATQTVLTVRPNPDPIGTPLNITLGLSQPPPTANGTYGDRWTGLTLRVVAPDGTVEILGPYTSDASGQTYTEYMPSMAGNYSFQSLFPGQTLAGSNLAPGTNSSDYPTIGDYYLPSNSSIVVVPVLSQSESATPTPTPTPSPSPSPSPTPTPQPKPTPTLSLQCQSTTSFTNFQVYITGSLASNGAGIPNADILLSYSPDNGHTWVDLTTASTDSNGDFTVTWNAQVSGDSLVKAVYEGNSVYSNASTTVNFVVSPYEQQNFFFSVTSNSTITAFYYNSTSNQLTFATNGTSGTTGYVDLCIPESLVTDISSLKVYLDGAPLTYTATEQDGAWLVSFSYHQSSHQVTVDLGSAVAPVSANTSLSWQWITISVIIAAVIVVVASVILWKRRT